LTIKYVTVHDVGHYTCRAVNATGQAEASAPMTVISKNDILFESQHPDGLEKIQYLEDSRYKTRSKFF
jgi:titin